MKCKWILINPLHHYHELESFSIDGLYGNVYLITTLFNSTSQIPYIASTLEKLFISKFGHCTLPVPLMIVLRCTTQQQHLYILSRFNQHDLMLHTLLNIYLWNVVLLTTSQPSCKVVTALQDFRHLVQCRILTITLSQPQLYGILSPLKSLDTQASNGFLHTQMSRGHNIYKEYGCEYLM